MYKCIPSNLTFSAIINEGSVLKTCFILVVTILLFTTYSPIQCHCSPSMKICCKISKNDITMKKVLSTRN